LISAPFNALGGMAKGAFNGLIRNTLVGGLAISGLMFFGTDYLPGIFEFIGKPEWGERLASMVRTGGAPAALGTAFATAAAGSAAWGAARGAIGGVSEGFGGSGATSPEQAQGIGMGTVIGGGLALAAVTAVAIGAIKKDGISHDAGAGDRVEPPATPGARGAQATRNV
jgi:hypothetical protein